jgi:hypothetical protein
LVLLSGMFIRFDEWHFTLQKDRCVLFLLHFLHFLGFLFNSSLSFSELLVIAY